MISLNDFSSSIRVGIGKKELICLVLLLFSLGIISSFNPFLTFVTLTGLILLLIGTLYPREAFLVVGIFLIFQAAIVRNMMLLGSPEEIVNFVKRADEFIWILFIAYILLHYYKGSTWELKKTQLAFPAMMLAIFGLISAFYNRSSLLWSSIAIFLGLKGFFMYWIASNINIENRKVILFFKTVIYILFFCALIGILQFMGLDILAKAGTSERLGVRVAHSIFAHHGTFGSLMAVGIALTIGLTFSTKKIKWPIFTIIMALGLIASSVRRSLLGLLFGLIFVLLNHKKFEISKKYTYASLWLFILLLTFFGGRVGMIIKGTKFEYGASIHPRYWLYFGGYKIIRNKPLLGEGPGEYGSFVSVLRKSKTYAKYGIIVEDRYKMDAYWASIAGEYGLLGLLAMVLMLVILFRTLIGNFNLSNKVSFMQGIYIGYIILFIDFLVESITSSVYLNSLTQFILFAGIGLLKSTEIEK